MDSTEFIVTIQSPKGVKHISLPAEQVRLFAAEHTDEWRAALFLADQDLTFTAMVEENKARQAKGL